MPRPYPTSIASSVPLLLLIMLGSACAGEFEDGYLELVPAADNGQCYAGTGIIGFKSLKLTGRVRGNEMILRGGSFEQKVTLDVVAPIPENMGETKLRAEQLNRLVVSLNLFSTIFPYRATGSSMGEARITQTPTTFAISMKDVSLVAPGATDIVAEYGCRIARMELGAVIERPGANR